MKNTKNIKDKVTTIRLTNKDFERYEIMAIKQHISVAALIRTAIEKGLSKKTKS
jgi:hypothetical protein